MNREQWLGIAVRKLTAEFFAPAGLMVPGIRVSCGWPRGSGKILGQCWHKRASGDGTYEIFVSPSQTDMDIMLHILLHEMTHAVLIERENYMGHGQPFAAIARDQWGMAGRMTMTNTAPGSELEIRMQRVASKLKPYPHAVLADTSLKESGKDKKVDREPWSNPRVTFVSTANEAYILVMRQRIVSKFGAPVDPWGKEMKVKAVHGQGG